MVLFVGGRGGFFPLGACHENVQSRGLYLQVQSSCNQAITVAISLFYKPLK